MKKTIRFFLASLICFSFAMNANAQILGNENEAIEEIIVYGTPFQGFAEGAMGNWLSFEIAMPNSAPMIYSLLWDMQDAADRAAEKQCAAKIQQWRSDCKETYLTKAAPICLMHGMFTFVRYVKAILPERFRSPTLTTATGTATGMGCAGLTRGALQWCDALAASDGAPEFVECKD